MTVRIIAFVVTLTGIALTTNAQKNNPLIVSGKLLEKASNLYDSGEYKKAIAVYQQIDRNDTNYISALYGISISLYGDSQFNAAIAVARQAMELNADPSREPDLINQIGISYNEEDSVEHAVHVFDSGIAKYPTYSLLYLSKGTSLIKLKRWTEAEAVLKQAVMYNPYSYSCHYKLGFCAINQGKLVPAMLSFIGYLLLSPDGRYHVNAINWLNRISYNKDTIQTMLGRRSEDPGENYQLLEQILLSKIALDKSYKPLLQLDDPVSRQIQVLFEKMQYQAEDSDFYMQYYIPWFKTAFTNNQFEPFINRMFLSIDLPVIQNYIKKHEKDLTAITNQAVEYLDNIRASQMLNYTKRSPDTAYWGFNNAGFTGHGIWLKKSDKVVGPWTYLYGAGNLRGKGNFNANGDRDGDFTWYYFDGKIKGKETYRNGKQQGEETYFYSTGLPSSHSWYKDGQLEGESIGYYWVGSVNTITHYHADKEDGEKITFYSNGDTDLIEHYVAGKLNGEVRSFSHSGLEVIAAYKDGELDGVYKKYYPDHQLNDSGLYTNGKQEGEWKWWHPNGQLKIVNHFLHDKGDGERIEYYDNGQISETATAKNGKTVGTVKDYDDDGKLYAIYTYSNDNLQRAQFFDKTGKQISESVAEHKSMHVVNYRPDGSKRSESDYDAKGDLTGNTIFYYENGKINETDPYQGGSEEGPCTTLYLSGAKHILNNYSNGKKDGYHQEWYANGQLQEEGWYSEGQAVGNWLFYDEMGTLTDSNYYANDALNGYKTNFYPNGKRSYQIKYHNGWMQEWVDYDTTGKMLNRTTFVGGSGKLRLVYPNGGVSQDVEYVHGKIIGTRREWYFDGRPMTQSHYTRGLRDSVYTSWYYNGHINTRGAYVLDEKTGVWKYYLKNGTLNETAEYKHDELDGILTYYYWNGKVKRVSHFKEGKKEGAEIEYDPDGTLAYQITYHNDDPVSYSYWDAHDSLVPAIPIPLHSGKVKTLFPNGKTSAEFEFVEGYLHGDEHYYYTNGQLKSTDHREYGEREGSFTNWFPNGKVKETGTYKFDDLQGPYRIYNEQGILVLDEVDYNGASEGTSRIYDDTGKLIETDYNFYGTLISAKK